MEFLRKIKDRAPEYDANLEDLISRFTVMQGGRAGTAGEGTTWEQGKYFANKYEIYMYASLLGLKNGYNLPFSGSSKKTKFIEIKSWQPQDVAEYIIMGVLAKSDIDLNDIEEKEDDEVEKEILKLRKLMEEYANGGFDMIRSKLEQDPSFFDNNENCFIDLLEDKLC
jgi:hypothetical protein